MAEITPKVKQEIIRDKYRGALLGLAAGDALGTTVEFRSPGRFNPVTDMIGGGPFSLKPGEWTDDTSMALCLAVSLLEKCGFDAKDQLEQLSRRCFDAIPVKGFPLLAYRFWREKLRSSAHNKFHESVCIIILHATYLDSESALL